jgi:hypothetical protein
VAHAVLALVAGTVEPFEAMAGRVAAGLLAEGLTGRERDANARDRAGDRRDDLAARARGVLDGREAAVEDILAAADLRDRLAEERDRRADERDRAADGRPFTSREEYEAAAPDCAVRRGPVLLRVDRDRSAGDRVELRGLPRVRGHDG